MTDGIDHPFAEPDGESISESFSRLSLQVGMLGPIGFLEHFQSVYSGLQHATVFYIFFIGFLIPPGIFIVTKLHEFGRSLLTTAEPSGRDDVTSDSKEATARRTIATLGHDSATLEPNPSSYFDSDDPRSWIVMGYEESLLKTLQIVVLLFHPNTLIRSIFQIAGAIGAYIRHRGRVPHPATYESPVEYRPPFDGNWTVVNGSPDKRYSHSWIPLRQRYAYDFVITDESGWTHDDSGGLESFYCFDEPILAPAEGTVVRAKDGHRDHHRTTGWIDPLQYRLAGNYVLIKHAPGEYSMLAHLREGSICVEAGQRVERGQEIGRCGHSGNSGEPHLHFHIQDHSIPYLGAGVPVRFSGVTSQPLTGNEESGSVYVHCGQTLRYDTAVNGT